MADHDASPALCLSQTKSILGSFPIEITPLSKKDVNLQINKYGFKSL